jgi:hypothetical protein
MRRASDRDVKPIDLLANAAVRQRVTWTTAAAPRPRTRLETVTSSGGRKFMRETIGLAC